MPTSNYPLAPVRIRFHHGRKHPAHHLVLLASARYATLYCKICKKYITTPNGERKHLILFFSNIRHLPRFIHIAGRHLTETHGPQSTYATAA